MKNYNRYWWFKGVAWRIRQTDCLLSEGLLSACLIWRLWFLYLCNSAWQFMPSINISWMELNLIWRNTWFKSCVIERLETRLENRNHTRKSMQGLSYRKLGTNVLERWKGEWDPVVDLQRESPKEATRPSRAWGAAGQRWGLAESRA